MTCPAPRLLQRQVKRVPGLHPGAIRPADDFDAPLPEELPKPKVTIIRR